MKLSFLATWTHVVFVGIIWIFAFPPPIHAQNWSIQVGTNISQYHFTNSSGNKLESLRPSSGRHLELGYQKILLDTSKLLLKANAAAIYFTNHSTQAKLLSMFRFGGQLSSDQFNASGNAGINQFTYHTEYIGLGLHAGLQIPLSKKTSLEALGKINGQFLIQGTQTLDTQNLDLSKDPQFNGLQVLGGYVVQLNHRINSYAGIHLGFQSLKSIGVSPVNSTELAFQPNMVFVGIRLFTN
jgi:hypothetical protein